MSIQPHHSDILDEKFIYFPSMHNNKNVMWDPIVLHYTIEMKRLTQIKLPARSNICCLDSEMLFVHSTEAITMVLSVTILKVASSSWLVNDANWRSVVSPFCKEIDFPSPSLSKFWLNSITASLPMYSELAHVRELEFCTLHVKWTTSPGHTVL